MRPSIGARFVWTSKIDKKIPTRRDLVLSTWLSSNSTMSITVPSAGATIRFESGGAKRSGSRKNATVKRNSKKKNHHSHAEKAAPATASTAKKSKIHRASESVLKRIKGVYFGSLKQRGQDAKNRQKALTVATTTSWACTLLRLLPVAGINRSKPRDYLLF